MSDLERLNPLEAGFDWTIDWCKDFIGRDVLEKIKAEGGPKRTMMGFMIDDAKAALQFESKVFKDTKKIGRITCYTYG